MTAWSVTPIRPGKHGPATAVSITADDDTNRQAVLELARILTVEDWSALKEHAERLFLSDELEEHEVDRELAGFDEVLRDACRADGTELADVWRLRVAAGEEARDFEHAVECALAPSPRLSVVDGGAA